MSVASSRANETSSIANEATARRFVLPLNIDNANGSQNLISLKDCTATATLRKNSGSKPKLFLKPQHLTKDWMELPRINYNFNTDKYNYFYCISGLHKTLWTTPEPHSVNKEI